MTSQDQTNPGQESPKGVLGHQAERGSSRAGHLAQEVHNMHYLLEKLNARSWTAHAVNT